MKIPFSEIIIKLANSSKYPIYAVGGFVRDFLMGNTSTFDLDLASPTSVEDFLELLNKFNLKPSAVYKHTATVLFEIERYNVEFTSFRRESYQSGGKYLPTSIQPTKDIVEDAKRRDFKCNAIYYDIKNEKLVDLLGGVLDIKNKRLDTVIKPNEVFIHDGLRLLRLARFTGELGFTPTRKVLIEAKVNASNIKDISSERVYLELIKILSTDKRSKNSPKDAHLRAIRLLNDIGVFNKFFCDSEKSQKNKILKIPNYLIKTLGVVKDDLRLEVLILGIASGYAKKYDTELTEATEKILERLKVSKNRFKRGLFLIENYKKVSGRFDIKKLRKFFAKNKDFVKDLLELKRAISISQNRQTSANFIKNEKIFMQMQNDGTPFSIKELKVNASNLIQLGFKGKNLGNVLNYLFESAILNPELNVEQTLLELAKEFKLTIT